MADISQPYGGPSTVAFNTLMGLCKIEDELARKDIQICIKSIVYGKSKKVKNQVELPSIVHRMPKYVEVAFSNRYPPLALTGELQACFDSLQWRNYDVIHAHSITEIFPYIGNKLSKKVLTIHGFSHREIKWTSNPYTQLYHVLNNLRMQTYAKTADAVVALNEYAREELVSMGIDDSKIHLIGNPVSESFFEVKKTDDEYLLYPAILHPRKNQLQFLKAILILKENYKITPQVIFTGSIASDYATLLIEFSKRNDLNVKFLGKVPYVSLPGLYSRTSIVVLLSHQETHPMTLLEAAATGTPVLASHIPAMYDIVADGKTGFLVDQNNPLEIADKLRILLEDRSLRAKMGATAREKAMTMWRDTVIARKIIELYENIIE